MLVLLLPVTVKVGLYVPAARLLFGRIVNVLVEPGVIAVVQFAPATSIQFATVGSASNVTF